MKHLKKMICIVLSMTLILLCAGIVSVGATDEERPSVYLLGDANVDGSVEISDATYVQRALAKYNEPTFKSQRLSDVNLDGEIDIMDATMIQRYLALFSCPTPIGEEIPARTMTFSSGYAQSFVKMNTVEGEDYRNKGSDVIRFVVFVETDYDTDLDGKPDLVKAWVQVPRAAAEGDYQAPVLFEANPYSTSANRIDFPNMGEMINESLLMNTPEKRIPQGVATTEKIAEDFRYSDIKDYSEGDYNSYNYFLARGFAIVGSAGLGTRGSEGLELCGTAMEADAFKAVVEWIHGDRRAYSNRRDNLEVTASWSNGKTGMLGVSYMGTLAYEVAATGVDGLEAIAPNAGIASWYDYTNQQGSPVYGFYQYSSYLSGICASRFYDGIDDENAYNTYLGWRQYVNAAQNGLKGRYGEVWDVRDFSRSNKIKASALIFQGLNDNNVRPKQFRLMMEAFERCGATAKAVLHQGGHDSLGNSTWTMKIGTYENYLWLVNRWFSCYLAGCKNNIDRLPKYIVQSNSDYDGRFFTYDTWESGDSFVFDINDSSGELEIPKGDIHYWGQTLNEDTTIKGTVEVHLRLKADSLDFDKAAVKVDLVDLSTSSFRSFCGEMNHSYVSKTDLYAPSDGQTIPIYQFYPRTETQVFFTGGQIDIGTPDAGWQPESAVAPETPVQPGEWHDYVIYLEPEVYTIRAGHTLFIGISPQFENFSGQYDHAASITLDQSACYAVIPTDKASTVPYSR